MPSEKSALVLMHGILMSGSCWQDVVPLLSDHHEVFTPTALGHYGGPPVLRRPTTSGDLVDAAEHYLDQQGLERPHLVGLSLGGWMAIELARRGRAESVCALAPAGFWSAGDRAQSHARKEVRKFVAMGRLASPVRPIVAFAMKSAIVRKIGFRTAACHPDRISAALGAQLLDGIIGATINVDDLLASDEQIAPLDPLPCPITIAWSANDAVVQLSPNDRVARQRVPQASFTVLPGVGHVPFFDDPDLVARTILASTCVA
ncbi:alpha/beta fold hydrolase [Mycobacterium sp. NPDC051804]|uniref:alpha/beta fold hydrolase n=1 Tax=Mycobacterium sp. NPDC051804 TaxID=3364295 RepID=UPI0037B9D543